MNTKTKGYVLGAISAATYGMNPLFTLPLYADGMNPDSVLFFRYLFGIPVISTMLLARGRNFKVSLKQFVVLIVLGLLFSLSSLFLFLSYKYMDAGIASTILFVYPIMVAVIMTLVFKEKLSKLTMVCMGMAILGIGLLFKGGDGGTLSLLGTSFVLLSALSYAIYMVSINQKLLKNVATLTVTFYVLISGLALFATRIIINDSMQLPTEWYQWGNLICLGLFPSAISLLCTTSAVQYIGSTPTAILGALEPVTAIFFGVTLFGETLTFRIIMGLILIIVAVTFVIAGGNITQQLIRIKKLFPRIPFKKKRN